MNSYQGFKLLLAAAAIILVYAVADKMEHAIIISGYYQQESKARLPLDVVFPDRYSEAQ